MTGYTDDTNDMVLLDIDRDSWKGQARRLRRRAESIEAINADLLAALEALKDAALTLDALSGNKSDTFGHVLEQAYTAIAKAKGIKE